MGLWSLLSTFYLSEIHYSPHFMCVCVAYLRSLPYFNRDSVISWLSPVSRYFRAFLRIFSMQNVKEFSLNWKKIRTKFRSFLQSVKYYNSFVIVTILLLTLRHYDRQTKITISVFSGNKPSLLLEKDVAFSLNYADFRFLL